jgi:hypothetical protein
LSDGLDQAAPAILVWLQEGHVPDLASFNAKPADLIHGPEAWPRFDEAFRHAMNIPRTDEQLPWIKVGNRIIPPEELRGMYVPGANEEC